MRAQSIAASLIIVAGLSIGIALLDHNKVTGLLKSLGPIENEASPTLGEYTVTCRFEGQSLSDMGTPKSYSLNVHLSDYSDSPVPESLEFPDKATLTLFPSSAGPLGGERFTATEERGKHLSIHIFRSADLDLNDRGPLLVLSDESLPADGTGTFFTKYPQPRLLVPAECTTKEGQKVTTPYSQVQADAFQLRKAWTLAQSNLSPSPTLCTDHHGMNVCFHSLSIPLSDRRFDAIFEKMLSLNPTWGCPAGRKDLSYLWLTHWTREGEIAVGEMLIESAVAQDVVSAFGEIFVAKYPIERMRPQDWFSGEDATSMAANNTSGFRCPQSDQGGQHPKGRAVDINPLINPFIRPNERKLNPTTGREIPPPPSLQNALKNYEIEPLEGWTWAFLENRDKINDGNPDLAPLLIEEDSAPVQAFSRIGWVWGGHWNCCADYQHFSDNGY